MPGGTSPVQKRNSQLVDLLATDFVRRKESIPWTDYRLTSTMVGWSAFTTQSLWYMLDGGKLYSMVYLAGTSNSVNTSFTLPRAVSANWQPIENVILIADNGVWSYNGLLRITPGSATISVFTGVGGAAWTASGTKYVIAQFWYVI